MTTLHPDVDAEAVLGAPPSLAALVRAGLDRLMPAPTGASLPAGVSPAALLRLARAMSVDAERPLVSLADALGLTDAELFATGLLLAVETDPALPATIARLQGAGDRGGRPRPTLGLLVRLVADLGLATAPLATLAFGQGVRSGLITLDGDAPLADRPAALAAPTLACLLGATPIGLEPAPRPDWQVPPSWHEASAPLQTLLATGATATILLRCGDAGEASGLAAWLCAAAGRVAVPVAPLPGAWPPGVEPWLVATGAVPIVTADPSPGETLALPAFGSYRGPLLVAAGPDGACAVAHGPLRSWSPPIPRSGERAALWRVALPTLSAIDTHAAAASLRCSPNALYRIAARAALDAPVSLAGIATATQEQAAEAVQALGGLARLISLPVADEAFIAPPAIARQLRLLLARLRLREESGDGLGPALANGVSCGIKALLVGASGTGKTLAARWLAAHLRKPLLLVDAGGVSSKYIGETEKNLARLFAVAEAIDCILLFDEADSLFGARTDVAHASDRFANAQTNYLLQRIESFDGIALLTSNSRERFDGAFMRRLDMILEVPLPAAPERRALWLAHLGESDVSPDAIATLAAVETLAGGHIRGAVLTAGALARDRGGALTIDDLKAGIAAENAKIGRGRAPIPPGS